MRDKFNHLWSMPGISTVTASKQEVAAFLHQTGGSPLANGHVWDVKVENLGAGVYRVRLEPTR